MSVFASVFMLAAVLTPVKGWFTPEQPIDIQVKDAGADASLALTHFTGGVVESKGNTDVGGGDKTVNVKELFPELATPGTYILYLKKKQATVGDFLGTPLVIEVRDNRRGGPPGPMVVRVVPLRYAVMHTSKGDMTWAFYYDVAPNTSETILNLAADGYYDGIQFHRVIPGFVIQGGDPTSFDPKRAGTGGPGFTIDAEFNDRPHDEGALSMARNGDPAEGGGAMPRPEFANSAGSQFFICLDYSGTKALDRKYTVFGKVVDGMKVAHEIEGVPTSKDQNTKDRPLEPQTIKSVEVKAVTAQENPYAKLFAPPKDANTAPAAK